MTSSLKENNPDNKILCIGGSPRKNGNSDIMLDYLTKPLKPLLPVETIQLRDLSFSPCIGCEKCRKANQCTGHIDAMNLVYPKIINSRGLVLVSPTHHYNITAIMKSFIDRMYCFYNFYKTVPRGWSSRLADQGRKAAIIAICEQEDENDMGFTIDAMRLPLEAFGYEIVDTLAVFRIFKKGGVKEDPETIRRISEIADKMGAAVSA